MTEQHKLQLENILKAVTGFLLVFLLYQGVASFEQVKDDISDIKKTLTEERISIRQTNKDIDILQEEIDRLEDNLQKDDRLIEKLKGRIRKLEKPDSD